jgi:hypothetical protein
MVLVASCVAGVVLDAVGSVVWLLTVTVLSGSQAFPFPSTGLTSC